MRVLITGGNGQVGRALLASAPSDFDAISAAREELDIIEDDAVEKIAKIAPDLIINAAAFTAVDRAEDERGTAETVNADAVLRLTETGIPLVQISTDYVFDGRLGRPARPDDHARPMNAYGATKLAGEKAALDVDALVVRTAWVYAAEGRNFVTAMLSRMRDGQDLRIVADQVGTPTHAASLARSIWALVEAKERGIHHFTDAGAASWYDFAVAIAEEAETIGLIDTAPAIAPIKTEDYPTPAKRPHLSLLDCHATWAVTGTPKHWRTELRKMLKEHTQ